MKWKWINLLIAGRDFLVSGWLGSQGGEIQVEQNVEIKKVLKSGY